MQPAKYHNRLSTQAEVKTQLSSVEPNIKVGDFPGGAVVKNPPGNAGDTGSSPGPGRFHMPGSN